MLIRGLRKHCFQTDHITENQVEMTVTQIILRGEVVIGGGLSLEVNSYNTQSVLTFSRAFSNSLTVTGPRLYNLLLHDVTVNWQENCTCLSNVLPLNIIHLHISISVTICYNYTSLHATWYVMLYIGQPPYDYCSHFCYQL